MSEKKGAWWHLALSYPEVLLVSEVLAVILWSSPRSSILNTPGLLAVAESLTFPSVHSQCILLLFPGWDNQLDFPAGQAPGSPSQIFLPAKGV